MVGPAGADVPTECFITNNFPEKNDPVNGCAGQINAADGLHIGAILSVKQTGLGRAGLQRLIGVQ